MPKAKRTTVEVQGATVTLFQENQQDIICLTDIAKFKNPEHPDDVIRNWLRSRGTVEFLGVWERLNNPDFNPVEFDGIRMQTGLNRFRSFFSLRNFVFPVAPFESPRTLKIWHGQSSLKWL